MATFPNALQQEVVNHINKVFPSGMKCPLCSNARWDVNGKINAANTIKADAVDPLTDVTPLVLLTCNHCAHVVPFAAITIGIDVTKY